MQIIKENREQLVVLEGKELNIDVFGLVLEKPIFSSGQKYADNDDNKKIDSLQSFMQQF